MQVDNTSVNHIRRSSTVSSQRVESDHKLYHPHERLVVGGEDQQQASAEIKMKESVLPDLSFVYKLPDARRGRSSKSKKKIVLDLDISPPKTTWFRVGSSSDRRRSSSNSRKPTQEENDDDSSVLSSQMERLSESIRSHLEELQQVDAQLLEDAAANASMDLSISGRQGRRASAPVASLRATRQQYRRTGTANTTGHSPRRTNTRNNTRTSTPNPTKGIPRRCVSVPTSIYVTTSPRTPSPLGSNQHSTSSRRRSSRGRRSRMVPTLPSCGKMDSAKSYCSSSCDDYDDASSTAAVQRSSTCSTTARGA